MSKFGKKAFGFGAIFGGIIAILALAFGLSLVLAIPVWLLWNWLVPMIFGLTRLSLIQAWGVAFLSSLLFKSESVSLGND